MKISNIAISVVAAALASSSAVAAQENTGKKLEASLDGASEVAPVVGDPDGSGTASIRVNPGQRQVCYSINVALTLPATAAHIHRGAEGVNGGVVVGLAAPSGGNSQGCVSVTRELALELIANPAGFYVNVHSAPTFRNGAVRGQLGD